MKNKHLSLNNAKKIQILDIVFIIVVLVVLAVDIVCLCLYNMVPLNSSSSEELLLEESEEIEDTDQKMMLYKLFENQIISSLVDDLKDYLNNIVIVLFPLVTTILSISISVSKDEIYGLDIARFRTLNIRAKYSLLRMILITIIIFIGCIICHFVPLALTMIVLNMFAIIYSIVFLVQEIPILSRDSNKLHNIIATAEKFDLDNKSSMSEDEDFEMFHNDLKVAVGYLSYKEGFDKAFKTLNKYCENDKMLMVLNTIVSSYYDVLKTKSYPTNDDLIKDIAYTFDLINSFFKQVDSAVDNHISFLSTNENIYDITNLIFWFVDEVDKANLFSKYEDDFSLLFLTYLFPTSENKHPRNYDWYSSFLLNITNSILFISFDREKTWFFDWIIKLMIKAEKRYDWIHLDSKYLIFISIYVCYNSDLIGYSDEFKASLNDFQNKDLWKQRIKKCLQIKKEENSFLDNSSFYLEGLIQYAASLNATISNHFFTCKSQESYINENFVVTWWLHLCCAKDVKYSDSETFVHDIEYSDNISQETKDRIKDIVLTKVNKKKKTLYFSDLKSDKYVSLYNIEINESTSNPILTYLVDFACTPDEEEIEEDEKQLIKKKNDLIQELAKIYGDSKYYCKNLKISKSSASFYHSTTLMNIESELNDYTIKHFIIPSLCYCIQKAIAGNKKPITNDVDRKNIRDFANFLLFDKSSVRDYYKLVFEQKTYELSNIAFNINIDHDKTILKKCKLSVTNRVIDSLFLKNDSLYHYTVDGIEVTTPFRSDILDLEGYSVYSLDICGKTYLKFDLSDTETDE